MLLKTSKYLVISLIAATSLLTLGCEDDADNKLVAAQECLDKLRSSDPAIAAKAQACADKVSGINSTHANIIRCSAYFMVGGITPLTLLQAFKDYDDAPRNEQPGILMGALVQTDLTAAQTTYGYCKASGVSSLIFIASMSYTGTLMADAAGGSADPEVFIDNCINTPGDCDDTAVGNAVISMYDSYCIGDTASTPACQDIGSAISAGGTPAEIAQALYLAIQ